MFGKKWQILIVLVAIFFGYELSKTHVPSGFESPLLMRAIFLVFNLNEKLAYYGHALNIGNSSISNFRYLTKFLTQSLSSVYKGDENVTIVTKNINNVRTRIYTPVSRIKTDNRSIMIYFHGESYDLYLAEFSKQLDMIVVSIPFGTEYLNFKSISYGLAPENPYPAPINDCYAVTKHIIDNPNQFGIDKNRIALAGDSAGGNAVAVLTQRLRKENSHMPKLQILIYPWLQMLNFMLPARIEYHSSTLHGRIMDMSSLVPHYLGIEEVSHEIEEIINTNDHVALISDRESREKIKAYLNTTSKIPEFFRKGRKYYEKYDALAAKMYPEHLNENSLLKKDAKLAQLFKKLSDPDLSPLLAEQDSIMGLPKAYFQIVETDFLRDEGLLYANRLISARIQVQINLYDKAFHPCANLIHPKTGFEVSRKMQKELIHFLKENL